MIFKNIEDRIKKNIHDIDTIPNSVNWKPDDTWDKLEKTIKTRSVKNNRWYYAAASMIVLVSATLIIQVNRKATYTDDQSLIILEKTERILEQNENFNKTFFMDVDQQNQTNLIEKSKMHFSIYMVCRDC